LYESGAGGSTLAFAAFAFVAVVMRHAFDGTGLILSCSCLHLGFDFGFINFFYVSIRTTENYEFDTITIAGVTGNTN